ncbi:MAG: hypothetical protein K6C99_09075 [Lachnospiraceae bacterium]|nr:hypothetical protein [Lachnospiraceae bacterium]
MILIITKDTEIGRSVKEHTETGNTGKVMLLFGEDISSEERFFEDGEMSSFIYLYHETGGEGGSESGVFRINRILDRYYPDLLLKSDLPETSSGDENVAEFYLKAAAKLPPHRIHILKVRGPVTDSAGKSITAYIGNVIAEGSEKEKRDIERSERDKKIRERAEKLAEEIHASESMKRQIEELVRYSRISGIDFDDMISELGREGLLPVADKKEGKKVLGELQRRICGSAV